MYMYTYMHRFLCEYFVGIFGAKIRRGNARLIHSSNLSAREYARDRFLAPAPEIIIIQAKVTEHIMEELSCR